MEAVIFNIKRFAVNDGPGIRTSIFFKGCPLKCLWCHNPESQSSDIQQILKTYRISDRVFNEKENVGYHISPKMLLHEILKDQIFFDESHGGVTFTGGEPLMQADFLLDILKKCKKNKIHTCIDTCGHCNSSKLREIANYTDLFLYDLKHLDNALHNKYTGVGNNIILNNLKMLIEMGKKIVIRFPLIEGMNDSELHLKKIKDHIQSLNNNIELNILPYHSLGREKYNNLDIHNPLKDMKNIETNKVVKVLNYFNNNNIKTIIA